MLVGEVREIRVSRIECSPGLYIYMSWRRIETRCRLDRDHATRARG